VKASPERRRRLHFSRRDFFLFHFSNDVDIDLLSLTPRKTRKKEWRKSCNISSPATPLDNPPGINASVASMCGLRKKGSKRGYSVADTHSVAHSERGRERERERGRERKTSYLFKQWKETFSLSVCGK
jgi:hypothetical protein